MNLNSINLTNSRLDIGGDIFLGQLDVDLGNIKEIIVSGHLWIEQPISLYGITIIAKSISILSECSVSKLISRIGDITIASQNIIKIDSIMSAGNLILEGAFISIGHIEVQGELLVTSCKTLQVQHIHSYKNISIDAELCVCNSITCQANIRCTSPLICQDHHSGFASEKHSYIKCENLIVPDVIANCIVTSHSIQSKYKPSAYTQGSSINVSVIEE